MVVTDGPVRTSRVTLRIEYRPRNGELREMWDAEFRIGFFPWSAKDAFVPDSIGHRVSGSWKCCISIENLVDDAVDLELSMDADRRVRIRNLNDDPRVGLFVRQRDILSRQVVSESSAYGVFVLYNNSALQMTLLP